MNDQTLKKFKFKDQSVQK